MKSIKTLVVIGSLILALSASLLPATAQPLMDDGNLQLTNHVKMHTHSTNLPKKTESGNSAFI